MDKLWAPWRINYISNAKKQKGCLFCRTSKSSLDRKNLIILRSRHVFVMLNKFPYNNGHLMAAPYRHIKDLKSLTQEEILDMFSTLNNIQDILKKTLNPAGFNIGINAGRSAGAGIPGHLHIHIVPRWKEDTNFMPVVFDTKIISQSLDELYDKLSKKLGR
ncbi:MAG TPA: HIT domain-containing protein [Candidatus Omnitrophota bacterium]|nr:HIT domain-containing protein [Candidatus Omnitrophota bacterium]